MSEQYPVDSVSSGSAGASCVTPSMVANLTPREVLEFLNNLIKNNEQLKQENQRLQKLAKQPRRHTPVAQSGRSSLEPEHANSQNPSLAQSTHLAISVSDSCPISYGPAGSESTTGLGLSTLDDRQSLTVQPVQAQTSSHENEEDWQTTLPQAEDVKAKNAELNKLLEQQKKSLSAQLNEVATCYADREARALELADLKGIKENLRSRLETMERENENLNQRVSQLNMVSDALKQTEQKGNHLKAVNDKLQSAVNNLKGNLHEQKIKKVQEQAEEIKSLNKVIASLRADMLASKDSVQQAEQRCIEMSRELSSVKEQLAAQSTENERLRTDNGSIREDLERAVQRYVESSRELNSAKEQLEAASAENERLRVDNSASDAARWQEEQRYADSCKQELEMQRLEVKRLRQANNDMSLKLDELKRSRDSLMSMCSDPTRTQSLVEMQGQLDEMRGLLVSSEDLSRKRGETIADLNRQLLQRVERSVQFVELKSKVSSLEQSLQEAQKARDEAQKACDQESSNSRSLGERVVELQAQLDELQLEDIRRRHGSPQVAPTVVSPTAAAGVAGTGPLRGPASVSAVGQLWATAAPSHPNAWQPHQRPLTRGGSASAAYRPLWPGHRASGTIECPYCGSNMPDSDSRDVHMKDCPRRPADDDS